MLTVDVVGLYTNIPHEEGIQIIKDTITETCPIGKQHILDMLKCVLKFNNFRFDDTHYLQVNGTAMGTRVAPSYANLFMNHLETHKIKTHKLCPKVWFRFIDDIWSLFIRTEVELQKFIEYLNTIHKTIKFTFEYSKLTLPFLDVLTYIEDSRIKTTLFVKKTNNQAYLDFTSCHPQSMVFLTLSS